MQSMTDLSVSPATVCLATRQSTAMGKSGMEPSLTVWVRCTINIHNINISNINISDMNIFNINIFNINISKINIFNINI